MGAILNNGAGLAALALCLVILVRDILRNRKNPNSDLRLRQCEKDITTLSTILVGVDGGGGIVEEIKTVRQRLQDFANKLMELDGKITAIVDRLEKIEGWREDLGRRV